MRESILHSNGILGITGNGDAVKVLKQKIMKEWNEHMTPEIEQKYRSTLNNIEELYYEVDLAGNLTFFKESS